MEKIKNNDRENSGYLSAGKVTFSILLFMFVFQFQLYACETRYIDHAGDSTKPDIQAIQWDFEHLGRGTYDEPTTMVYLVVSGIKHEIQKIEFSFGEVNRESYMDYQIPQDALIACRGWWAGAGIDYWVIKKDNKLVVFSRELGETITDKGEPGDYMGAPVEIKTITLP